MFEYVSNLKLYSSENEKSYTEKYHNNNHFYAEL